MNLPRLPPLAWPLIIGFVLRLAAAVSGHGWFAVDDYEFGVEQAATWLSNPDAPFSCGYRSPLMSRAFWLLMKFAQGLGARDPAHLLQGAYAGLGIYSLAAIPGVHRLARARLGASAALSAAWLMAIFAPMPRISTRALIEVVAIVPLVWGAVFLDESDQGDGRRRFGLGCLGGLLFGLATLLRFQIGVLFPAALAWTLLRRGKAWRAGLPESSGLMVGGLLAAVVQGIIDLSLGRVFLHTPWEYLTYNLRYAHGFGTSPWYTFLLHFVMYTVPPVTLVLVIPMARALRRHALVAMLFAVFVATHSLIGHKEDRFMFPVLPLFFVPLGAALTQLATGSSWQRRGYRFFWGVNLAGVILATFSDAHRNLTVPLLHIARAGGASDVACVGFGGVPRYYGGPNVRYTMVGDVDGLERAVREGARPDYVWFRGVPGADVVTRLEQLPELHCEALETYPGDLMDRILVRVNRHNARRAPTAMARCSSGETLSLRQGD